MKLQTQNTACRVDTVQIPFLINIQREAFKHKILQTRWNKWHPVALLIEHQHAKRRAEFPLPSGPVADLWSPHAAPTACIQLLQSNIVFSLWNIAEQSQFWL